MNTSAPQPWPMKPNSPSLTEQEQKMLDMWVINDATIAIGMPTFNPAQIRAEVANISVR